MPSPITDLNQIPVLAARHHDDFEVMRYTLEADDDLDDSRLDAFVDQIAAPIIAAIDCTQCANCCRALDVYLTASDAQNLVDGIQIPLEQISTRYVDFDAAAAVDEWGKFRCKPCVFLQDNLCSVYAQRPESCRTYPALTPDFRWTLADTIEGAGICPIIYNTLIDLLDRLDDFLYHSNPTLP